MKIAGKKPWYLEYLLIIVGTGLREPRSLPDFDAAGMVTGGFFRYCDPGKSLDKRFVWKWNSTLDNKPDSECSIVSSRY